MITNTSKKILSFISTHQQARAADLVKSLGISQVAVHKQLNKLLQQNKIMRVGKPPQVFYVPALQTAKTITGAASVISKPIADYIDSQYLYISPQGQIQYGLEGFINWTQNTRQDERLVSLATEYVHIHKQSARLRGKNKLIDATQKMKTTFGSTVLKKLYYADFYSLPQFGKSKLGQLVLHAKQSQNTDLIDTIVREVKPLVLSIIRVHRIDTVAFIPASVPRKIQFMDAFASKLGLNLDEIPLVKAYPGEVVVAQKTLSRLEERIRNAHDTIFIDTSGMLQKARNILIIDDAVGSGATLSEVAKKLAEMKRVTGNCIGFATVGSLKGFEVIKEI